MAGDNENNSESKEVSSDVDSLDWRVMHKQKVKISNYRSSPPQVFLRKGVLKICSKFAGEHPCRSVISIKLLCQRPTTLLKKRLRHICFPVNFAKFLRAPFFIEHFCWLLLYYKHCTLNFAIFKYFFKKINIQFHISIHRNKLAPTKYFNF